MISTSAGSTWRPISRIPGVPCACRAEPRALMAPASGPRRRMRLRARRNFRTCPGSSRPGPATRCRRVARPGRRSGRLWSCRRRDVNFTDALQFTLDRSGVSTEQHRPRSPARATHRPARRKTPPSRRRRRSAQTGPARWRYSSTRRRHSLPWNRQSRPQRQNSPMDCIRCGRAVATLQCLRGRGRVRADCGAQRQRRQRVRDIVPPNQRQFVGRQQ